MQREFSPYAVASATMPTFGKLSVKSGRIIDREPGFINIQNKIVIEDRGRNEIKSRVAFESSCGRQINKCILIGQSI
jgi:hypothetical protein